MSLGDAGNYLVDILRTDNKHTVEKQQDTGVQLFFKGSTDLINQVFSDCSPLLLRLQTPLVTGQMVQSTTTCTTRRISDNAFLGSSLQIDTLTPVELVDSVMVPVGTFTNVIHVTHTTTAGNQTDDVYIAPGVGIIRIVSMFVGKTQTFDLTGGTIDGQPITGH
jgi:hypothetical protein